MKRFFSILALFFLPAGLAAEDDVFLPLLDLRLPKAPLIHAMNSTFAEYRQWVSESYGVDVHALDARVVGDFADLSLRARIASDRLNGRELDGIYISRSQRRALTGQDRGVIFVKTKSSGTTKAHELAHLLIDRKMGEPDDDRLARSKELLKANEARLAELQSLDGLDRERLNSFAQSVWSSVIESTKILYALGHDYYLEEMAITHGLLQLILDSNPASLTIVELLAELRIQLEDRRNYLAKGVERVAKSVVKSSNYSEAAELLKKIKEDDQALDRFVDELEADLFSRYPNLDIRVRLANISFKYPSFNPASERASERLGFSNPEVESPNFTLDVVRLRFQELARLFHPTSRFAPKDPIVWDSINEGYSFLKQALPSRCESFVKFAGYLAQK